VEELLAMRSPDLKIDLFPQFTGRRVYALTVTGHEGDLRGRRKLFLSRPHAHEPAGTAACTELIKALTGYGDYAGQYAEWRQWALGHFVLTVVPDANPGGSQRAPVKFWDGSEIPNERFFLWMFGESGETPGERFPRVDAWDMRQVTPPALVGIAYEQIDEHTYVEPNRDYRSTFFRSFFELDRRYHYEVWLDLHQTEYLHSDRNAHVNLPTCYDELPEAHRARLFSLGEAIHARWRREGGAPFDAPAVPYRNNEAQRNFLTRVWRPLEERMAHLVTEVQNNNPRTPISLQVHLQLTAILETMDWMAREGGLA
jgi:hypothetical protein